MVMQSLRRGTAGGILKYILFGLLVMAAGGLVLTDVGGFFRGGRMGGTDVARVGGESLNIGAFNNTVRRTLSRIGMSPQEAYRLGYIEELLNSELRNMIMEQAASETGVYVSRERIARQVNKIVEPMVGEGQSKQDVLDQLLMNQGMSERQFVALLRRDVSGGLLRAAITSGFSAVQDSMARDVYLYQNEQRDIAYVEFPHSEYKDMEEPTEDRLRSLYEATREMSFAVPETRALKIGIIKTDKVKETLSISEEELQQEYEKHKDGWAVPEKRRLEQAVLTDEDEARKVLDLAQKGTPLKEAVKEVTGEEKAYLGENSFTAENMLEDIRDIVFAMEKENEVAGPIQTPLGWHVIVLQEIEPPFVKEFADVKEDIRKELLAVRLSDQQYELADAVDDLMAGGATLEEAAQSVEMEIKTLPPLNVYGQGGEEGGKSPLEEFGEEAVTILQAGFELMEGEASPVMELRDGQLVVVSVQGVTPKSYKPFEEVKEQLRKKFIRDQQALENRMRVTGFMSRLNEGGASLEDFAKAQDKEVHTKTALTREMEDTAPISPQALDLLFQTAPGKFAMAETEDGVAIAQITASRLPEIDEKAESEIGEIRENLIKSAQSEAIHLYVKHKSDAYGARINRDLLDRVYGPASEAF